HTGPSLSPFNAWVMLKGLETLDLRMQRHCENALAIAKTLEKQKSITRLLYPWLPSHPQHALAKAQMKAGGSVISFEVAGGKEAASRLLTNSKITTPSNKPGDAKSLISPPATTTHQRLTPEARAAVGITEGFVRLSVGLESVEDLIADLTQAFRA